MKPGIGSLVELRKVRRYVENAYHTFEDGDPGEPCRVFTQHEDTWLIGVDYFATTGRVRPINERGFPAEHFDQFLNFEQTLLCPVGVKCDGHESPCPLERHKAAVS